MQTFILRKQSHTLACMLREFLFENGATFASCTVNHPLDDFLTVKIEADDPKYVLLLSLNDAKQRIDEYLANINNHKFMNDLMN